jgi:UDP-N-acetylmuramoylalanine--D-glutamate ligase
MNTEIKKVLIMGLGVNGGGVVAASYFAKKGYLVTVTDLKSKKELKDSLSKLSQYPNIIYHLGFHTGDDFVTNNLIIRNPGVPKNSSYINLAKKHGNLVLMQEAIFFKECPSKNIIAVTGTKGKTTTSYLIYEILKANNKKVFIAGNMRLGVLDILDKIKKSDFVVLELSSWQCEALDAIKQSPFISVITNIYPDHLNRYKSYYDYAMSKSSIFRYQNPKDHFITIKGGEFTNRFSLLCRSQVHLIDQHSFKIDNPLLFGEHNVLNMAFALKVSEILKLDFNKSLNAVKKFKGVPYRQEVLGKVAGVLFINDTTATNPTATISSINVFKQSNPVLILGGADKDLDFSGLCKTIGIYNIKYVLLKGSATDKMVKLGLDKSLVFSDFSSAVSQAFLLARRFGGCVLLSPGAASFGMFTNEFDRGDKFNEYYRNLSNIYKLDKLPKNDSRIIEKGDVFVAMRGTKVDSHQFIAQVCQNGVEFVVAEYLPPRIKEYFPRTTFLKVFSSRNFYSDLCSHYYGDPQRKLKLIGVTGTDGKTTTAHFINSILRTSENKSEVISTVSSPGLHTTTPNAEVLFRLLFDMVGRKTQYCVLEVTSHALDQGRVFPINFVACCITNVTSEHLDAHKTYNNYLKTKAKIFGQTNAVFLNNKGSGYSRLLTIAKKYSNLCLIDRFDIQHTSLNWKEKFPGDYNMQNALCAASVANYLSVSGRNIEHGLDKCVPPEGRFQFVKNNFGANVVIDFAHTPNALESLLKTVKELKQKDEKIITVFGCAGERDKYKRPTMGAISSRYSDIVVLTSEDPRSENPHDIIADIIKGNSKYPFMTVPDRKEAIIKGLSLANKGDWILICGKGHEKSINIAGVEYPWSDKEAVQSFMKLWSLYEKIRTIFQR